MPGTPAASPAPVRAPARETARTADAAAPRALMLSDLHREQATQHRNVTPR
jgi:hypothetical protein